MNRIRTLIFKFWFIVWTILTSSIMTIPALISRKAAMASGRIWAYGNIFGLRLIMGTRHEIRGMEFIDLSIPTIYASKHQSIWETMMFFVLLKEPVYILKQELSKLPFYGTCLKAMGAIIVDRAGGFKTLKKMIEQVDEVIKSGHSIVIFPEGTRTRPYATPAYMRGIAALYGKARIVPVAVNSGYYWYHKDKIMPTNGKIILEFLPPLPTNLNCKTQIMDDLEKIIETKTEELLREAPKK